MNGSSSSTSYVKLTIPDLPSELREQRVYYEVCDSDGRNCDSNPASAFDGAIGLQLRYRNGRTRFWFAEPGEGGRELTPRFAFDPNSPDCKKKDQYSARECRFGYGFLKP